MYGRLQYRKENTNTHRSTLRVASSLVGSREETGIPIIIDPAIRHKDAENQVLYIVYCNEGDFSFRYYRIIGKRMTNDCGKTGAAASTRGRFPASGQQSHSSRWVQHRPESSTAAVAVVVNLSQFKRKIIESALACAMYETTAPAMTGSSSSNNSRGSHSANINTTKGTNIGTLPFPTTTTVRSSLLKAARGRSSSSSSSKTFHSRSSRNYSIDPSFVPPPSKRVCQGSNNYRTNSGGGGVSFNPDVDYYEGSPYEPGRSDAEAIALYQHDIWYSVRVAYMLACFALLV